MTSNKTKATNSKENATSSQIADIMLLEKKMTASQCVAAFQSQKYYK